MRFLRFAVVSTMVLGLVALVGCSQPAGDPDPVESLSITPDGATIDDQSNLQFRATGVRRSGQSSPLASVSWEADGGTIDASGLFSPSGAGAVTITATGDGLSGTATVQIVAPGSIDVRVIDSTTGLGIDAAIIRIAGVDTTTTSDGTVTATGSFSGAIDVTAWATGYWPLTVRGTSIKNVVLPLRPANPPAAGDFNGRIEFEGAFGSPDPEPGNLYLGFAAASLSTNLLAFNFEDLLGDDRPISLGGIEVDAPSNIFVHGVTSDYQAKSPPGQTATFALGGQVELSTIVEIAGNVDQLSFGLIIQELIPIFNTFHYNSRTDLTVTTGGTVDNFHMDLDQALNRGATVVAPTLLVNDPNPLVIAAGDLGALGIVPTGFGIVDLATGQASLQTAAGEGPLKDADNLFALVVREGGIDADSNLIYGVLQRSVVDFKSVALPDFLPVQVETDYTSVATVPGTPGVFAYPTVNGADFTFHTITGTDPVGGGPVEWDVATAGNIKDATWPFADTETGVPLDVMITGSNWAAQSVGLDKQTYESLLVDDGNTDLSTYAEDASRIVVFNGDIL